MPTPRNAVLVLACAAGLGLAGCSEDDLVITHFQPALIAATAPDTVVQGQPFDVKAHWRSYNSCQSFDRFHLVQVDDSTYHLIAWAVERLDPDASCQPADVVREAAFRVPGLPAGRFTLEVYGAAQRIPLAVRSGASVPQPGERHAVRVENAAAAGGVPVPGAVVKIVVGTDTLATLVTDAEGDADTTLACAGGPRAYRLWVSGASGRQVLLPFVEHPAVCGVAERTRVRL